MSKEARPDLKPCPHCKGFVVYRVGNYCFKKKDFSCVFICLDCKKKIPFKPDSDIPFWKNTKNKAYHDDFDVDENGFCLCPSCKEQRETGEVR